MRSPLSIAFAVALAATVLAAGQLEADIKEPPFFQIDGGNTGPLTMEELQVHIPQHIADKLTENEQRCYLEQIEALIAKAGDPVAPDWGVFSADYEHEDWDKLTPRAQRAILAQVTLGEAILLC